MTLENNSGSVKKMAEYLQNLVKPTVRKEQNESQEKNEQRAKDEAKKSEC